MNSFFLNIIKNKSTNRLLRLALKPIRSLFPETFQFAVNGVIKIKLTDKKNILLDCNETSHLSRLLYWNGVKGFEHHVYQQFIKLVQRGGTFLDIGANIGYYSLVACKLNPQIKCYAFEPVEGIYDYLIKNKNINALGNLTTHKIALSNFTGETAFHTIVNADFVEVPQLTGDGSLKMDYVKNLNYKTIKVQTDTLDNFVKQNNITDVQLIKIDTESTEDTVLAGGLNTLQQFKPVIFCEVLKGQIEQKIENIMRQLNYHFYLLQPQGLLKVNTILNAESGNDYLFIPAEKTSEILALLKT